MSTITIDDSQNYSLKTKVVGNYRTSKLIPISGGQSFSLPVASGTAQTQFEIIGNNVFNLSQSRLVWNTALAGDAGITGGTNYCMWADPLSQISRITLATRSGLILADIQDTAFFSRMVTPVKTKKDQVQQRSVGGYRDGFQLFALSTLQSDITPVQGIQISNDAIKPTLINAYTGTVGTVTIPIANIVTAGLVATTGGGGYASNTPYPVTATNAVTCSGVVTLNGVSAGPCNARPVGSCNATATAITEPQVADLETRQCFFGASNVGLAISYQLNLGEVFHHTIFQNSQDLYFGENILLTVTFTNASSFAWTATTATSPVHYNAGLTSSTPTSAVIGSLALYTSIQTNPECINLITHKVNTSGLEIVTPYVYLQKYTNSGTSTNIQQRFNRGMGSNLLRCYFSLFSGGSTANLLLDNSNITPSGGALIGKCSTYYSAINSLRLQEFSPVVSISEDWILNQSLLDKSSILSINQYRYQWCHIDSWCNGSNSVCNTDDTVVGGLDLTDEKTYTINATTDQARLAYLYSIVQRKLIIKTGMIMFA